VKAPTTPSFKQYTYIDHSIYDESFKFLERNNLLSVSRSSLYYRPVEEKPENVKMMTRMDKHLIRHPTEGEISMVYYLKAPGYPIGPKRIRRLFQLMGREHHLSEKKPDPSRIT